MGRSDGSQLAKLENSWLKSSPIPGMDFHGVWNILELEAINRISERVKRAATNNRLWHKKKRKRIASLLVITVSTERGPKWWLQSVKSNITRGGVISGGPGWFASPRKT